VSDTAEFKSSTRGQPRAAATNQGAPVIFGVAGIGGYAGAICDRLLNETRVENPLLSLSAVCDPDPGRQPERIAKLTEAGVKLHTRFDELLAEPIEAVWLPLPIDLHRPFTERALAAGKAVMVEKPAAGCVDDIDAMIAARDRHRLPVAVGFQDAYHPEIQSLKRRLLAGELGTPRDATVLACWPRTSLYYGRTNWAGMLKRNDTWILDSPANNALAHQIHLILFLLGSSQHAAATPISVEAELYRVNPIENYDTCSLRITLENGARVLLLFTHACATSINPEIEIDTDRTQIRVMPARRIEIGRPGAGEIPQTAPLKGDGSGPARAFSRRLRARTDDERQRLPIATLEMARAHSVVVCGASEATRVSDVLDEFVRIESKEKDATLRLIPVIEAAMRECVTKRQMLNESGLLSWTSPAGTCDVRNYAHFAGPKS
jgi:predicted dehydrogenase